MFPGEGEAGDSVPGEGGTVIMYFYEREGLYARASTRGRRAFVFPDEGEADDCVSGRGGGRGLCFPDWFLKWQRDQRGA